MADVVRADVHLGSGSRLACNVVGDPPRFERRVEVSAETKAEVFKGADGWRFRLLSKANGEVLAQSEAYSRRIDAVNEATQLVGDVVDDVEVLEP
jgi:uncharacterized protein YegP (UPF0339 family)